MFLKPVDYLKVPVMDAITPRLALGQSALSLLLRRIAGH
jgi:hypothetical protein